MNGFKDGFADRQSAAAKARQSALEKLLEMLESDDDVSEVFSNITETT